METVTFQIKSSEKYLFGFNRSNYVDKTDFFKKEQPYDNVSYLLQQQTKLFYGTVDLTVKMLFNVYFLYRKSLTFWVTDQQLSIAGQR